MYVVDDTPRFFVFVFFLFLILVLSFVTHKKERLKRALGSVSTLRSTHFMVGQLFDTQPFCASPHFKITPKQKKKGLCLVIL